MYTHHHLTKVLVLSCVNKSFHIGSHFIYLYWLVCHWRLKMTPLVLYFSRWAVKADCVEMLISNEQKEEWNQNNWHEFEVLMYCNLLKYSWSTNPSNWIVLIITGCGFLTLNCVKKTEYTKGFGVERGMTEQVLVFKTHCLGVQLHQKKPTWECSQQDIQCRSHHRLCFCSSQAWESPPATVTEEKIQPQAKQLFPVFPLWSQEAILTLGSSHNEVFSTAWVWSSSWSWEEMGTGVCPRHMRGPRSPVLWA